MVIGSSKFSYQGSTHQEMEINVIDLHMVGLLIKISFDYENINQTCLNMKTLYSSNELCPSHNHSSLMIKLVFIWHFRLRFPFFPTFVTVAETS